MQSQKSITSHIFDTNILTKLHIFNTNILTKLHIFDTNKKN